MARRGDPPLWSVLADESLILYPSQPRPSFADEVLSLLADGRVSPAATREGRELQTAMGLVASGLGVAVVPASVHRLRSSEVVFRTIEDARGRFAHHHELPGQRPQRRIEEIKSPIEEMYAAEPDWLTLSDPRINVTSSLKEELSDKASPSQWR